ncbi:DUF1109 domain-containing protein [Pinirhizobacter sp.]|jgi:hypothetical protein|uniref:DUF1109 domain-containing protein n=1 Tax=Pinirhizobacter sp. TaxID=2950432 RepID=UPI002F3EBC56
MKTENLIDMLAAESPAVDRAMPARRFTLALLAGIIAAVLLMAVGLGVRPDLATVVHGGLFWAKVAFALAMLATALLVTLRLSRPGLPMGGSWAALATPVVLVWGVAAFVLAQAPAGTRLALELGHTWKVCPPLIAVLSIPACIAMFWAVRSMAPVRLRLAGAATGLVGGATATLAYCLHCPEMAPPFWAIWYLAGMLIPAAVGAVIGPRVLRW